MIIKKIPVYQYYNSTNFQEEYILSLSDVLYEFIDSIQVESPYVWQSWQSQHLDKNGVLNTINGVFPEPILTPINLPVYLMNKNGETIPSNPFFENSLNMLSLTSRYYSYNYTTPFPVPTKTVTLDNLEIGANGMGYHYAQNTLRYYNPSPYTWNGYSGITGDNQHYSYYSIYVLPSSIFKNGILNVDEYIENQRTLTELEIRLRYNSDGTEVTEITIYVRHSAVNTFDGVKNALTGMKQYVPGDTEIDSDNPYGGSGSSTTGGGDGSYVNPDDTTPAEIPDLPSIGAADLGFITMYNPTKAQLKNLSDFMWSNLFDLDTYKKLFSDPMQSIIGLAIVPVQPNTSGAKNVMFGSIDSGVSMTTIGNQYVQLDCGSVDIETWAGSFMDYSPYTKISLYLPYIGIHQLSADDIIGGSIHVVYNIDVLSGACGCFVEHSTRGVLYSYNGSCITNIPLTSVNFSSAIQNAVSAVCSGVGIIAGMATGAAPVTAMSAAGLLNSAANTALNSKPSVQRSGSLGGSAGILSIQKPYVIIERPNVSVPASVQNFVGQTSNITLNLGACHGFTMCEHVHINGINATSEEIKEIEALLKEGVIL